MRELIALGVAVCLPALAQADDVRPTAWTHHVRPLETVERVTMPAVDVAALKQEDEKEALAGGKSLRYAASLSVDLGPDRAGTWETLDDARLLWRLRIHSRDARSLNLGFTRYSMPAGGRLLVYSADAEHVHRPFTEADNEDHGQLWTPAVLGDEMVVEVTLPAGKRSELELRLSWVNHDYRGIGREGMETSGACNIDVACPAAVPYASQVRAVGVISTGGSRFCSGSLLNNTSNDATPYFITSSQCGLNATNAASLVVYWNYQNSVCRPQGPGTSPPGDGLLTQFNSGSFFRAAHAASDFTLLELDDAPLPAFNVFFAGWNRNLGQFTSPVTIHHPNGAEKRISLSTTSTQDASWPPGAPPDGSHFRVTWGTSLGVTEPGSTGAPLYTSAGQFLGQLHGGLSACGGVEPFDYFGRLSTSWTGGGTSDTRLSNWLDPGATGATTLGGINGCTAPPTPTGLAATASAPNRISLSWNPSAGAAGYNVYRASGGCPQTSYTLIASNVTATTYDDDTVSGGLTYSYVVRAVAGCPSANSNCSSATATGVCHVPPTFGGLTSVTSAGSASCSLNVQWGTATTGCPGSTVKYNVYRSTTPGFTPGPGNLRQSCLTGTAFSDTNVTSGTRFYYVVRAEDSTTNGSGPCNTGNQDANLVERSAAAFAGSSTVVDAIESGPAYWDAAGGTGSNSWNIVNTSSNSPTQSWFVADPPSVSDRRLAMANPGVIPPSHVLSFWHRFNTETTTGATGFDGGVVEYSTDGGVNWFDILAGNGAGIPPNNGRFLQNGYNRTLSLCCLNPLPGRQAWSGDNLVWQEVRVSMADFNGFSVLLRWRFGSDSSNTTVEEGWWIDDVTLRVPQACTAGGFLRGDFSLDGKTDLLWRHDVSGENVVWYMDGTTLAGGTFLTPAALADVNWKMVGTHDFNADLKTDILWRHEVSGENVVWYMNGTMMSGGTFLTPAALADGNWKMAGTGLFNVDARPDIVWHHQVSGEVVVWYMDGPVLTSGTFTTPSSLSDTSWRLVGVADFNSDNKPDLLWHNQVSGQLLLWYMNDAVRTGTTFTTPNGISDVNFRPVAVGNYGTDNKPDIVWRNSATGVNLIWLMDGAVRTSEVITTTLGDANWKIVGPR